MGKIEQFFLIGSFLPSLLLYYFDMKFDAMIAFLGAFIALSLWVFAPKIRSNDSLMRMLRKIL